MSVNGDKVADSQWDGADDPQGFLYLLGEFLIWMQVQNYSPRTVDERDYHLRMFVDWCAERSIERPNEVTREILERYQRHLFLYRKKNKHPLSFKSQHARLVSVRMYFGWLSKSQLILYNPSSELQLPRVERHLPKVILTEKEVEEILNTPDVQTFRGIRDRALMEVLYSTGVRRMEVVNLSVYDIHVERGTVTVRQGKGRKDRTVPIGERALAWVQKYQDEVRPRFLNGSKETALFVTSFGKRFSVGGMGKHIRDYITKAGIEHSGACHLFRHTMATSMLENGADIRYIQEMLGHRELSTTQVYTQVSIQKLKEIHTATHPARMKRASKDSKESGQIDESQETDLSETDQTEIDQTETDQTETDQTESDKT